MLGPVPDSSAWLTGVRRRTPLGRLGSADDIAAAVVAVHALDWVTGQVLAADGGLGLHSPIDPTGCADWLTRRLLRSSRQIAAMRTESAGSFGRRRHRR
ncbi:MAG: hypothetical protein R2690_06655 [Acidimicrobiales bacterium]